MLAGAGRKKSIRRIEQDFQKSLVKTLRLCLMPRETMVFAVPNGGYRRRAEAAILIGMGVVPGIPDLLVVHKDPAGGPGLVLGIECKAPGGKPDELQEWIHAQFELMGIPVCTVATTADALDFLKSHNVPMRMAEVK